MARHINCISNCYRQYFYNAFISCPSTCPSGRQPQQLMGFVRARLGSKGTMEVTRGYLLRDAQREKTLGSTGAGLSSPDVQTEEHRRTAAAVPEGAINAQGRFSLSPASPEIIAELERLLKAATGHAGTSDINAKSEKRIADNFRRSLATAETRFADSRSGL
jgi:hypothetical protein